MTLAWPAARRCVTRTAAAPALALSLLAAACGNEPHGSPAPATFRDVSRHALHVGLEADGPSQSALGQVVAARLTDGGRHLVVLDFVAPYVKVYDRSGRFETAFMPRGGGPGEGRSPTALAVSGDSLILVADAAQGLSVFDLRGNLRAHALIPRLVPLAAASACPGEWLVYGPRYDRGPGKASWLHRVRIPAHGEPQVQSLWEDTVPRFLSTGLPYGMVADRQGVVVRHTLGRGAQLLRLSCGQAEPVAVQMPVLSGAAAPESDGGKSLRTSVSTGMHAPAGVALVNGAVVYAEKVHLGSGEDRLDLTYLAGGAPRMLSLAGSYVLQDSRPGLGVLVSTSDPVPQVFLVRAAEFVKMFPRAP